MCKTLVLGILFQFANQITASGEFGDSNCLTDPYCLFRCGMGLKPWAECLNDEFDLRLLRNIKTQQADIVFNETACDEIDLEWLDTHPLTSMDTVGYALKHAYNTGLLRYGGKIGGRDAAPDAKVHPIYSLFEKTFPQVFTMENGVEKWMCHRVQAFTQFFGGFASRKGNATNQVGLEHQRFMDYMYEQEQADPIKSHEQWLNCIIPEHIEDQNQRAMPLGYKFLKLIKNDYLNRQTTMMFINTGRAGTAPFVNIDYQFTWMKLVSVGLWSLKALTKHLHGDFRSDCIGNDAVIYPHKTDVQQAFDQWVIDLKPMHSYFFNLIGPKSLVLVDFILTQKVTEFVNRPDIDNPRYVGGCDTDHGCNKALLRAYHNHTHIHMNGRYNEETGFMNYHSILEDDYPDGTINGPATYLNLTGDYVTLKTPDLRELPFSIVRHYPNRKVDSSMVYHGLSGIVSMAASTIFSPLVSSLKSQTMTETEQMNILREFPWNQDSSSCNVNRGNFTTWIEYKQHALKISKLHAFAMAPKMEQYGGDQQDCRYDNYLNTMMDPFTYSALGFSDDDAAVMSIAHILLDRVAHSIPWVAIRTIQIITGYDFVTLLESFWDFCMALLLLRAALYYVKISPARIGRMLDNRDKYSAQFKFLKDHRTAFLRKSKKMSERFLKDTPGLKARRAARSTNAEIQTNEIKEKFTFPEGAAHYIHPTDYFNMPCTHITSHQAIRKSRRPTKNEYVSQNLSKSTDLFFGVVGLASISLVGIFSAFMVGILTW